MASRAGFTVFNDKRYGLSSPVTLSPLVATLLAADLQVCCLSLFNPIGVPCHGAPYHTPAATPLVAAVPAGELQAGVQVW